MTSKDPAKVPSAAARELDARALETLRELDPDGRHDVVMRVMTAFDSSLTRALPQLAAERGKGDAKAIADLAHALKSSSGYVGALGLADACADIERRLRAGEPSDMDADIDLLLAEAAVAQRLVKAMLAR